MISAEEILEEFNEGMQRKQKLLASLTEIRDVHDGSLLVPLPEVHEAERPAIANMVAINIRQKAMRIASTMPNVRFSSKRPGMKVHDEQARIRQIAVRHWWDADRMKLKLRRRARHLIAYESSPVVVWPNFETGLPCWRVRDPLGAIGPQLDVGESIPDWSMFHYTRPLLWLAKRYPAATALMEKGGARDRHKRDDDYEYRVVEYIDGDEVVVVALGEKDPDEKTYGAYAPVQKAEPVVLLRLPNRAGIPLVAWAGQIGLADDSPPSLKYLIGMHQMQAELMALEFLGMKRSIWPESWFQKVDPAGGINQMADPMRGIVGEVEGGQMVFHTAQPNPYGMQIAAQLERAQRVQAAVPAEFGGESSTNVRTGRRGDSIMSATIDYEIQEIQEILEASLEAENKIAVEVDKGFFGRKKTIPFSATKGDVEYTPSELWAGDTRSTVRYSSAGVDLQGLVIEGAQRLGVETLSRQSFMEIDPMVEDVEAERDRIVAEALDKTMLLAVQARAQQDPGFVKHLAEMANKVLTDRQSLAQAYLEVDQKLSEEQAQQAQEQQQAMPGMPPGPEGQPGLAAPGETIGAPPASMSNLSQLLNGLRNQRPTPVGG